jgi:hypothetical protein
VNRSNPSLPPLAAVLAVTSAALLVSLASPSLSVAARTAPDAGVLHRFDEKPFAEEKTPTPTPADWKPEGPVAVTDKLPPGCNAYRVREWVRIRCSHLETSVIAQLGGSREGVNLFIDKAPENRATPPGGEAMFPVRRGDRRVFEWSTFGDTYDGIGTPEVAFLISESWAPGDPAPIIVIHSSRGDAP